MPQPPSAPEASPGLGWPGRIALVLLGGVLFAGWVWLNEELFAGNARSLFPAHIAAAGLAGAAAFAAGSDPPSRWRAFA